MWKNVHGMILNSDEKVDLLISIAAKYDLLCTYKIGVYGKFKQHELELIGPSRRYRKFIREVNTLSE